MIKKTLSKVEAPKKHFGIWVKKADDIAQLNSEKLFIPASLSKIPTELCFLSEFSMDHRFKTWVYKTGDVRDGVLSGDLYLKGGGDPSLVSESLWLLVRELKRTDIKRITGQLYVDESFFDDNYYSNGRQKRRVDRAYDAPVSGLSFNWNTVTIYVRPGHKVGESVRVYTDPELPNIKVVNKAKTVGYSAMKLRVDRKLDSEGIVITVTGSMGVHRAEKAYYKSIGDAALWTGYNFKKRLNKAGVQYLGDVKKKQTPADAESLVEFGSWDMPRVMSAMSKFSNNFVAEMLTKHLGKKADAPGTIELGLSKINHFLTEKGWREQDFKFINPSGFTRENKMRADRLGELLEYGRKQFQWAPEFLGSLPMSGTDGTLKKRMQQVMKGKVRAKTGYLSGVVGLAGYMQAKKGEDPIVFVFFYNGPYEHDWKVRALFDELLWRLYQIS